MDESEAWWQDKAQKGQDLLLEITALADRARASGFPTAAYILKMAATELSKELDSPPPP
jgi:hypothetical protein